MNKQINIIKCSNCSKDIEYEITQENIVCEYCKKNTKILKEISELIIPLTVETNELEDAFYHSLSIDEYAPDDLIELSVILKIERFYVPSYWFAGKFNAKWTASFGYDGKEKYTEYQSRSENGKNRQIPVTMTRTVTDWRPFSGIESGNYSVISYAGSNLDQSIVKIIEHTSKRETVVNFNFSFTNNFEIYPFDKNKKYVYENNSEFQINNIIDTHVKRNSQGDRQQNWNWTVEKKETVKSVLVPLCHVIYEYKGRQYNFWADGTDTKNQFSDEIPKDKNKTKNINIGFIPPLISVAIIFLGTFFINSIVFSKFMFFIISLSFGYAFFRKSEILKYSKNLRELILRNRKNNDGSTFNNNLLIKPWMLIEKNDRTIIFLISIFILFISFVKF